MRRCLSLLFLPVALSAVSLGGAPAWSADAPKPDPVHHARVKWEQHFADANIAHDGHMTLEEAKGGYVIVAKHFDDIDVEHKGFVTVDDIRAWRVMRKAAHRLAAPPQEDGLKPRNAMQLVPVRHVSVAPGPSMIVALPMEGASSR